ncbi:MAG: enoyl-CoA hydratase [Acidimicrobiia bacterium]|nr:enoyl-CoA hydratase [Acidimicrobiia bacterium]
MPMAEIPSEVVLYDVRGRTAIITLNRPARLNAWNPALHEGYFSSLDRAAADPGVRAIVVTGAGRGFCAGADMEMLQRIDPENGIDEADRPPREASGRTWTHVHATTIPKPVIAAVNGACAGLGFVHALACDLRFAAEGAKFTVAFSRRGLIAEHGSSWLLPRLVGQSVALDLALSGRVFLAEEAAQLGVVNRVCRPDVLLEETLAYADDLATNVSPTSMAVMKQQLYTHPSLPLAEAVAESDRLMHESLTRADVVEGVRSYVEKRTPDFSPYVADG